MRGILGPADQTNWEDVEETLICLDVKTGQKLWEHRFRDYLSDTTYNRYAIGAPVVDAETGNVYLESTCGQVFALSQSETA